jgi:predicted MFS family arabinose efflux permease
MIAVGFLISIYGIGKVTGGSIGGKLSDRYSIYYLSAISLLLKAVSFFLLLLIQSYTLLTLNLFIRGLCEYTFTVTNNVWILHQCQNNQHEKLKAVSLVHVILNLGIATSSFLVEFLSNYGFDLVLMAGSLFSFCSLIYLTLFNLRHKSFSKKYTDHDQPYTPKKNPRTFNRKIIFCTLLCLFFGSIIVSQIGTTYVVFINDKFPSAGIKGISFLFTLNPLLIILFQTPLINACKNFNKIFMAGLGAFLMGSNMFLLNFSPIFSMAIIACIFYTIGEMLFFSTIPFICYEYGDEKSKGNSLGRYQMIYAASTVLGPLLGGFISHKLNIAAVWYLCGALGSICLILCGICNRMTVLHAKRSF